MHAGGLVMNSRFLRRKVNWRQSDWGNDHDCESSHLLARDGEGSDNEENCGRTIALRSKRPTTHYIEHMLQSEETLSSLALRYNCSVAQIKQANNILRDNEVFALRSVRIPVPAVSSFRDDVPGIHASPHDVKRNSKQVNQEDQSEENGRKWTEDSLSHQSDEELHNPLFTPIPLPSRPLVDISDTELPDLNLLQPHAAHLVRPDGFLQCSGADCGLSWVALLLCTLLLGFVGPLIYIFFLYEHEQEHKIHNHTST